MARIIYLTGDEVAALLQAARDESPSDYALLSTVYFFALRVSEAAGIRRSDFDYARKRLTIGVLKRRSKNNPGEAPRVTCDVPDNLAEVLREQQDRAFSNLWLFPAHRRRKDHPTRFHVESVYRKYGARIGLDPSRVRRPHCLRHSRAMHLLDGMKEEARRNNKALSTLEMIQELKDLLRHATDQMCLKYIHSTEETAQLSRAATAALSARLFGSAPPPREEVPMPEDPEVEPATAGTKEPREAPAGDAAAATPPRPKARPIRRAPRKKKKAKEKQTAPSQGGSPAPRWPSPRVASYIPRRGSSS